ncbi:hypothetical protein [Streptomyces violascens]|uniref:hypothetical protein n=1 Tax=Streptomyces violascens TaxID=67381 RepID=UPI00365B99E2
MPDDLSEPTPATEPPAEPASHQPAQETSQAIPADLCARLAKAEVKAAAAVAGVDVPKALLNAIRHDAFVNTSGEIDSTAISSFVSGLGPARASFSQQVGIGMTGEARTYPSLDARKRA